MTKKSISRLLQASLMCCLAVLFAACEDFATEDNPTPSYLSLNTDDVTLKVGDTYVRKPVVAGSAVVVYSSSDEAIATVDQEGKVTAIAAGTATITVQATGFNAAAKKIYIPEEKSYKVTVTPAIATITTAPVATAGDIVAGSTTALVAAGVADGGTMMYQVTATNAKPTTTDGFSATVPTAATLAGGTYYVWYYAKADAQHFDSEIAATAIEVTVKASYLKWDNTQKELVATPMPATYTTVENVSGNVNCPAGTYVVEGDVIISGKITLTGNVDLIIKDGAKLTVNQINGGSSNSLSIYGQANKTGQLVVNCSNGDAIKYIGTFEVHGCQVTATSSYGNCGGFYNINTFNVYGGSVDAEYTGSNYGYGIHVASNGSMNIYGGDVKAVGKGNSKGITGNTSTVTVYGGKLWAECAGGKALNGSVTLTKDAGYTSGKIETSDNGTSWTEYTAATTPSTYYVRVGY